MSDLFAESSGESGCVHERMEGEEGGVGVMSSDKSFWVGIPMEAINIIAEDNPALGMFLSNIALVLSCTPANPPPKQWVRERYCKATAHR